jgi:hypothetical protein
MATVAQQLANAANAQLSTGPRTEEGKARSARNAVAHGLAVGVLIIKPEERPEFDLFHQALVEDIKPQGALEMDALREFRDASWRLRQIRCIARGLFDHYNDDPFVNLEAQAVLRQLTRYRAAAEMSLQRALNTLRDLQTIRFGRHIHLAKSENEAIGPLASPQVFACMTIDGIQMNRAQRDEFDEDHSITECG